MDVNPITPVKKTIQFGRHTLTLETGEIARQAHGAVMVNLDDTCVLVTVVGKEGGQSPARISFRSRSITGAHLRCRAESRAGSSSAKAAPPRKRR